MKAYTLKDIADHFELELIGNPAHIIEGIQSLDQAQSHEISFLSQSKYRPLLEHSQAGAVILKAEDAKGQAGNFLLHENPYACYARVAGFFDPYTTTIQSGIHPTAVIESGTQIADTVEIGPYVHIGRNCVIDEGVKISTHCVVGAECTIGANTLLHPHVTLYQGTVLGQDVMIHSGAVIGSDGFGYAPENGKWVKIPQVGRVIIADQVEIGSNTSIDRGTINHTQIGLGSKLDNQIQIAHNVEVGEHTVMAGCSAAAGSAKIGNHCQIGGGAGVAGHLTVGDHTIITGMTLVSHNLSKPGVYSSAVSQQEGLKWRKNVARLHKLDDLARKVIRLQKELNQIKQTETK